MHPFKMSLSLAENVIVARADNCPLMLHKTQYSSLAIHMLLYIKGKENEKLLIDSILNLPFKYGTNSCQFHGLSGDDANKHLDKFLHVTQSIKVNGVTDDALRLYLFPHSLTHHATAWFDRLPRNSINTFEQMVKMFLGKYFPPSMMTKLKNEIANFRQRPDESLFKAWECYKLSIDLCPNHNMLPVTQIDTFYNGLTLRHRDTINAAAGGTFMKRSPEEFYNLIENMTAYQSDWDTSAQRSESSSSITSFFDLENVALKAEMAEINKNLMKVLQINQQVKAVTPCCETCGGPHSYNDFPATVGQTKKVHAMGAYQGGNSYQPQGASHGPNPPPAYQALAYKAPGYQEPVHQPPIPQPQVMTTAEFTNYMKENDAILKNMQTNVNSLTNSNLELKNMFGQFMKMNTTSSSGLGTLTSNTITNPKEDLKERETEVTKDTVPPTNNESTKDVQPSNVQTETSISNFEPIVAPIIEPVAAPVNDLKPNQKPSIPYPSRLHDQKLRDKPNDQKNKIFQIFKDLDFNISFTDALILMPKFGPTIKTLLTNKDKLYELARTPLNEHCSTVLLKKLPEKLGDPGKFLIPCDFPRMDECLALADLGASINLIPLSVWNKLSLPELTPTLMTLERADRLISQPISVAEDVFVKVGKFHFPADFVVVDFDANPRVPLILGRSFLKTGKALIDVFKGELTLRVGKEAITLNLDQTLRYSANYNDMTANQIDFIDMACEEYSDFLLEEVDAFLALEEDPTSSEVDHSYFDMEGDILLLEAFLNDDPSLPPPTQGNYLPQVRKELKICDDKFPVIIAKDLSVEEKSALIKDDFEPAVQHQRRVNPKIHDVIKKEVLKLLDARLIYPISDSPWVSPVHCIPKKGGFTVVKNEENQLIPTRLVTGWRVCIDYRKLNEATRKDHFPLPFIDQMLERLAGNEYYCFLDGFLGTFQRCMMAIVHDMIEKPMEVFMDGFLIFRNSFETCLSNLEKMLQRYKAKVYVIAKLPHPTTVKGICSFLGHAGFYRRFIQDFSKIARLMTCLFEKDSLKPLTFSRLDMMDPSVDIMARTTLPRRCLTPVSIGPQSTVMPMTWSNLVTLVNVRERFHNEMKCLKIPSKFAKFLTFGASISWGRSRLHEGTDTYSWPSITKAKELPTNDT
uniref:Reverse transcriptase domain-containing protein n=1 Tax=Tanacetum cinerariifolium TaxID=118510 RepID=A0A6L2JZG7_TANCI|nr:reverse transcriptase domain-containing protein [Tanacetum cinerariifolium]